ncbi:MAG: TonB-dependent receptor, partial [Alphaproteobacteria bacterium]
MIVSTRKIALLTAMAFTGASLLATSPAVAQLDELIVTATKREQLLQTVPIAISVFDTTQLRNSGVDTIHELMSLAPSFQSSSSNSETQGNTIRIRGIGTQGNNPGFESAVGVFIDNVFRARAGIALTELLDIERIEVLRGPQSTLFGRNTSAGALNIITKGPEFEFGGYVEGTYGNYDMYDIRGSVTGPIVGDKLAARF